MKQRKHYPAEQKGMILREFLQNNVPISQLAEKYLIRPSDIYNWKKKLFDSATETFAGRPVNSKRTSAEERKMEELQAKLKDC